MPVATHDWNTVPPALYWSMVGEHIGERKKNEINLMEEEEVEEEEVVMCNKELQQEDKEK